MEFEEQSRQYVVINTHKDFFRFNWLPLGVLSALGIFQRVTESLVSNIPGVVMYLDDILVSGHTVKDHLSSLEQVLQKLSAVGL